MSTKLSYADKFLAYMLAYNIGMVVFLVAFYVRLGFDLVNKFSTYGFTFFLGAGVPFAIVSLFVDFSQSLVMQILGWVLKFILALIFAWILTVGIEQPIQTWAIKIEQRLK